MAIVASIKHVAATSHVWVEAIRQVSALKMETGRHAMSMIPPTAGRRGRGLAVGASTSPRRYAGHLVRKVARLADRVEEERPGTLVHLAAVLEADVVTATTRPEVREESRSALGTFEARRTGCFEVALRERQEGDVVSCGRR